jgi:hypothetical protein
LREHTPSVIVDLTEIYEIRDRKERELAYYQKCLEELHIKMGFIQHEIKVTNTIIDMIEEERVLDIKEHMHKRHNQL